MGVSSLVIMMLLLIKMHRLLVLLSNVRLCVRGALRLLLLLMILLLMVLLWLITFLLLRGLRLIRRNPKLLLMMFAVVRTFVFLFGSFLWFLINSFTGDWMQEISRIIFGLV